MYRDHGGTGGGVSSRSELVRAPLDRKRINDALDKHLEKSSLSTSRALSSKDKKRLSVPFTSARKSHVDPRKASLSWNFNTFIADSTVIWCTTGESETDSEESDVSGSDGDDTSWISFMVLQSARKRIFL
ncbi:Putative casein kinase II subunit beta-4 [Linum perenne]